MKEEEEEEKEKKDAVKSFVDNGSDNNADVPPPCDNDAMFCFLLPQRTKNILPRIVNNDDKEEEASQEGGRKLPPYFLFQYGPSATCMYGLAKSLTANTHWVGFLTLPACTEYRRRLQRAVRQHLLPPSATMTLDFVFDHNHLLFAGILTNKPCYLFRVCAGRLSAHEDMVAFNLKLHILAIAPEMIPSRPVNPAR
jgi:hypothetical protein